MPQFTSESVAQVVIFFEHVVLLFRLFLGQLVRSEVRRSACFPSSPPHVVSTARIRRLWVPESWPL